ncbi:unnamed protein product [Ixodes pacificus]
MKKHLVHWGRTLPLFLERRGKSFTTTDIVQWEGNINPQVSSKIDRRNRGLHVGISNFHRRPISMAILPCGISRHSSLSTKNETNLPQSMAEDDADCNVIFRQV